MRDFETMPVGTAAALREAAQLLRAHEGNYRLGMGLEPAVVRARTEAADEAGDLAARVEALLAQCPFTLSHGPAVEITDARVG